MTRREFLIQLDVRIDLFVGNAVVLVQSMRDARVMWWVYIIHGDSNDAPLIIVMRSVAKRF